ncbi:MAG: glucokinase [Gammaproteobacteria bacterium]|jgi:glucokinase
MKIKQQAIFPYVVADVGGTNARFSLVTGQTDASNSLDLSHQQIYLCQDFINFEDLLGGYITSLGDVKPIGAAVAIAGPLLGNKIKMTNLTWEISIDAIQKQFKLEQFRCINDFGALAYSTLQLEQNDVQIIHQGIHNENANRAIIGPGTGLGIAGLVRSGDHWMPVAGEGGHMTYAPASKIEMEIRKVIEPGDKHISAERFVSGPGLVNIYKALSLINGTPFEAISPSAISQRAITKSDHACEEALKLFCKMLGTVAGNACLVYGAYGGVYLGGGILPKIQSEELLNYIAERFQQKGRLQGLLDKVPLYMLRGEFTALKGVAHWHYDNNS